MGNSTFNGTGWNSTELGFLVLYLFWWRKNAGSRGAYRSRKWWRAMRGMTDQHDRYLHTRANCKLDQLICEWQQTITSLLTWHGIGSIVVNWCVEYCAWRQVAIRVALIRDQGKSRRGRKSRRPVFVHRWMDICIQKSCQDSTCQSVVVVFGLKLSEVLPAWECNTVFLFRGVSLKTIKLHRRTLMLMSNYTVEVLQLEKSAQLLI